ncbi:hypothetical protein ACHAWF_006176 [Thalassiosira exigua]
MTSSPRTESSSSTPSRQKEWHRTGYDYWEDESNCPATMRTASWGRDLEGSIRFVRHLTLTIRPELKLTEEENGGVPTHACECGAGKKWLLSCGLPKSSSESHPKRLERGIRRVSKVLLLPLGIGQCDLADPSRRLISFAPEYPGDHCSRTGLQYFEPKENYYDVIWIQ